MQTQRAMLLESALSRSFTWLLRELVQLELAWTCELERSGLRFAIADAHHHLCSAIALLEDLEDPSLLAPHAAFAVMSDGLSVRAHEAYRSVLVLGQLVRRGLVDRMASSTALANADLAISRMLDDLEPYVGRADSAVRRTILDEESDPPHELVISELEPVC